MRRRAGGDRPGERLPVDRAGRRHRVRQVGPAQAQRGDPAEHPAEGLLRRRRSLRSQEHHLGSRARPRRGDLDPQDADWREGRGAPRTGRQHRQPEDGYPRVELRQRSDQRPPLQGPAPRQGRGAEGHHGRGRAGLRSQARLRGGPALPELRRADGVRRHALHRVRRLRRHLPDGLHHLHRERRGKRGPPAAERAGGQSDPGSLYRQRPQDRPHHGQGRGCLPALRAVRRALPDRRVGHAQVLHGNGSSGARMPQALAAVNDFVVKFANVNGSGSASANELFARAILRMGVPVSPRNIFPSNIQGLPTWYEVRVTEKGYLGRRGGVDIMVAMNPQTWAEDVKEIESGGYLFYDSTKPMPSSMFREDINIIGVPLTAITNATYTDARQRQLFKNIIYVGALSILLDIDPEEIKKLFGEQFKGKEKLLDSNVKALNLGRDWATQHIEPGSVKLKVKRADNVGNRIFVEGNNAAALGAVYGGATVCAWYPITPSSSLAEAFQAHCKRLRHDKETGKAKYAIVQAEDELASIGIVIGAGWNGSRAFPSTSGPRISLMTEFIGLASFAEEPAVIVNVQRGGPSTGMPTRTQQSDLLSCAYASNGDTKHVLLFPEDPRECFDFTADALDLADRLQTPVFVMTDLDIGMNHRLCEPFVWDDKRVLDRGKIMTAEDLDAGKTFGRYLDVDGDGIPFRTYPGTHPSKGSYFTRGTTKDEFARYSEEGAVYVRNMERLQKKFATAARIAPQPLRYSSPKATRYGVIYVGSTSPAMAEALDHLEEAGNHVNALRVRAFPFAQSVEDFIHEHDKVFVVEQNRDGQLRSMIMNEFTLDARKLVPVLHYDGTPITARFIATDIAKKLAQFKVVPFEKAAS